MSENIFEKIDPKLLSEIIFWAIGQDFIIPEMAKEEFTLSDEETSAAIDVLLQWGVVVPDQNGFLIVQIQEYADLNPRTLKFLIDNGYKESQIMKVLDLPDSQKEEISMIVNENSMYEWDDDISTVPINTPVWIHVKAPKYAQKAKTFFRMVEDAYIAVYDGEKWNIEPPYPKYDFSPLADRNVFKEETIISHWAELKEDDLDKWHKRLDRSQEYSKLAIYVDEEHDKQVYRALNTACTAITTVLRNSNMNDPNYQKYQKAYKVMHDLQACFDLGNIE